MPGIGGQPRKQPVHHRARHDRRIHGGLEGEHRWDPAVERAIVTQVIALLKLKRLEEARALTATEVRDPRVAARLLGLRGAVLNEQGNFAEAELLLRQSADRLRELGEGP